MGRTLIAAGLLIVLIGVLVSVRPNVPWLGWIGRLPGDISIKKEGFSFYFPITTCLVISFALMIIFRLFKR